MKKILFILILCFSTTVNSETITAKSWVVVDNGKIVNGQNTSEIRSIASITKLMTSIVYLDAHKKFGIPINHDILQRALVSSDNNAARKLCDTYPGGKFECINMMNLRAKELGLINTKFLEPTGLSVFNTSTAEELIKIVLEASKYEEIVSASHVRKKNTNPTIGKYDYDVSKTGFINIAGGCIVAKVKDRIVVLLGSKSVKTRIPELEKLLQM